ncbi:MAG: CAP domain-containing protein [Actinomycetota bacterium]|nr:CAP domain-containing protein [Actinomycetota bacterium]
MTTTPRHWMFAGLAVLVLAGLSVIVTTGDDDADTSSAQADSTLTSDESDITSDESDTSSTNSSTSSSSSTSSIVSTTVATTAPKGTAPAATAPTPALTISGCTTWSLTSINDVRAGVGLGALSLMGDAKACAWAHQLAVNGALSHDSADCGFQVAGYVGNTAQPVNANAPASIITNWFNSRSNDYDHPKHYEILTWPSVSKIALAFVTATSPDGSWRVYGVGNLCP